MTHGFLSTATPEAKAAVREDEQRRSLARLGRLRRGVRTHREDHAVIDTAGHLVGPFEVGSALIEHPAVAEAGVVGKPDPPRPRAKG